MIANLRLGGDKKKHFIEEVEAIANLANFIYVRQRPLYGNGVPLLDVEHLIGTSHSSTPGAMTSSKLLQNPASNNSSKYMRNMAHQFLQL